MVLYFGYKNYLLKTQNTVVLNWKTYSDENYGFAFKYPNEAKTITEQLNDGELLRVENTYPNTQGGGGLERLGWTITILTPKNKQPYTSIEDWAEVNPFYCTSYQSMYSNLS